jgi:hypothetical protein
MRTTKKAQVKTARKKQTKDVAIVNNSLPVVSSDGTIMPEALIKAAIEKDSPLEVMRELIAMQEKIRADIAKKEFFASMAEFQKKCPIIIKSKDVYGNNGKKRYDFAPLDVIVSEVKDLIADHGFSYTIQTQNLTDGIKVWCPVHHKAGHTEENADGIIMPIDPTAYMNDQQKVASAQTYAKRYAFCNAFGIMTGDQDTDSITPETPPQYKKPQEQEPPGAEQRLINATAKLSKAVDTTDFNLDWAEEVAKLMLHPCFTDADRDKYRPEFVKIRKTKDTNGLALFEKLRRDEIGERTKHGK